MTNKQIKQFKKEIEKYLDLEHDNMNQVSKLLGLSRSIKVNCDCLMFAYALGLASRQREVIWKKIVKTPIDNIFDDDLALQLQGEVCLKWSEGIMMGPNEIIREASKKAQEEYEIKMKK